MGMPLSTMTLAEFLAWENEQPGRHEFIRGEIFAMVGVRFGHHRVTGNLFKRIDDHLEATHCHVFKESFKLRLADEACFYPDLMVTCNEAFSTSDLTATEPLLIVEVLSPSTEGYNRGLKFRYYQSFATLREYVLVDPEKRTVEVYTRDDEGFWTLTDQTRRSALGLASIDFEIPLEQVFRGLEVKA